MYDPTKSGEHDGRMQGIASSRCDNCTLVSFAEVLSFYVQQNVSASQSDKKGQSTINNGGIGVAFNRAFLQTMSKIHTGWMDGWPL